LRLAAGLALRDFSTAISHLDVAINFYGKTPQRYAASVNGCRSKNYASLVANCSS
jgi:hypothetical protein